MEIQMKTMVIPLLLISLLGNFAFGQTADAPATSPITKGQPAPFDGVGLNNAAAQENQVKLQQGDLANQENADLNNAIGFKDKQIVDLTNAYNFSEQKSDIFSKEALAESEQLAKQQKDQTLEHILYFSGGAAIVLILDAIVRGATKNN
jgi:hypothetical protein